LAVGREGQRPDTPARWRRMFKPSGELIVLDVPQTNAVLLWCRRPDAGPYRRKTPRRGTSPGFFLRVKRIIMSPVAASQMRTMLPFSPPVAIHLPSGLNATRYGSVRIGEEIDTK